MVPLRDLAPGISSKLVEWLRLRWTDLRFAELPTSLLVMAVLVAISLLMLLAGGLRSRRAGRTHLALPALVPVIRGAGGVITDVKGGPAYPATSTVSASCPEVHAQVIRALNA